MLMSSEEQKKIAKIVNALIDIPLMPEDMEDVIFLHAVGIIDKALEDVLPAAFGELLRNAETGIDKDHARQFGEDHFLRVISGHIKGLLNNNDTSQTL